MLAALCTRYSIPYAQEMVEQCVQSYDPCQFLQRAPPPSQLLHPIPRVDAGDIWAFDFVGPLPKTLKGNQYLLTTMDLSTDWTIAQALPCWSGQSVLEMLQYIMYTYGKPLRILTDNGEEFMSYGVQGMLQRFGMQHDHTTPYHPQTNRQLEKFNDTLTQMLARMTALQRQASWDQALPDVLLAHCTHTSSSMSVSLFFLMYRREACLPSQRSCKATERNPTDEEVERLWEKQLEHVQNLARFRQEANQRAAHRMQQEASCYDSPSRAPEIPAERRRDEGSRPQKTHT